MNDDLRIGFKTFITDRRRWKEIGTTAIAGMVGSPFVSFLLSGGLDNPGEILSQWRRQWTMVIWIMPLVGTVWASVFHFATALLRRYFIPMLPADASGVHVFWFCTLTGFATGMSSMWLIHLICLYGLSAQTVAEGAIWTQAGVTGVMGIIFAHMFYAFHLNEIHMRDAQARQRELERHRLEGELMNMSMRIRPHFFFNALNTLSSLMDRDLDAAQAFLLDLSDLFRKSFSLGQQGHLCTWGDERDLLEHYLALERRRFGERLNPTLNVDAPNQAPFPAFFLQPLIENAIHHGISRVKRTGELSIGGSYQEGQWQLEIANSVPARVEAQIEPGHALFEVRKRARLLSGDMETNCDSQRFLVRVWFEVSLADPT